MELAKISHHGAVNGVTGSCHELHIDNNNSVLIDCGLFQGAESSPNDSHHEQMSIDFSIASVQALIITHVHIDHVGRIPYLLAAGFNKAIYCSKATAILLPEVLEDALKIGVTKNPQFIRKFIRHIKKQLLPVEYGIRTTIPLNNSQQQLQLKLKPAGHILGSAYIECELRARQSNSIQKIIFSGDLGAPYTPLLRAPEAPYGCDQLILESTYGDKYHLKRKHRYRQLKQIIEKATQNRGVVLIPAFSIGRTQELLYELETILYQYKKSGRDHNIWEALGIIVDSPLANEFTKKYLMLADYWDAEAQKRRHQGRHPLDFSRLLTINDHQTHLDTVKYLQKTARPAIVIAASGMCSSGRIVNYLQALIGDKRTDIIFTGYQAKGTPGRVIQQYGQGGYVFLNNQKYPIAAAVYTLSGYSAHADQANLVNFVKRMRKKPQQIRLVHGEQQAKLSLQEKFNTDYPEINTIIPHD